MPSKRRKARRAVYCMIPFIGHSGKDQSIKTKNKSEGARAGGIWRF